MSVVTDNAGLLELIVREIAANDPRCPYDAEACRTMPIDREYMRDTGYGKTATAILAAVAPMIAKKERERVKKLVVNECEDLMQRTRIPIQRAREDGHRSEEYHQEGRWHGVNDLREWAERIGPAAIRALEPTP